MQSEHDTVKAVHDDSHQRRMFMCSSLDIFSGVLSVLTRGQRRNSAPPFLPGLPENCCDASTKKLELVP